MGRSKFSHVKVRWFTTPEDQDLKAALGFKRQWVEGYPAKSYLYEPTLKQVLNEKKSYSTRHKIVYRHLDFFLKEAFAGRPDPLLPLEIEAWLKAKTGIRIRMKTILKKLPELKEKLGEYPLCEFEGKYRLNKCLYSRADLKPPRIFKEYLYPE